MSDGSKTRAERQAEVDGAHLCLLLSAAKKRGLIKKLPDVDAEACQAVIDEGYNEDVRPRHDLLKPAILLTDFEDLRNPVQKNWKAREHVAVSMSLAKRERAALKDVTPLWYIIEDSRNNQTADIMLCQEGVAVRMEGQYYVLRPDELFVAVAQAFGLNVDSKPAEQKPKRQTPPWMMRFSDGDDPQ